MLLTDIRTGSELMTEYDPRDEGDDEVEGDELEAEILQADHAFAAELPGTTAAEAKVGEGLDRALAEERPERAAINEVVSLVDDGMPDLEEQLAGDAVFERDEFTASDEDCLVVDPDDEPVLRDHAVLLTPWLERFVRPSARRHDAVPVVWVKHV